MRFPKALLAKGLSWLANLVVNARMGAHKSRENRVAHSPRADCAKTVSFGVSGGWPCRLLVALTTYRRYSPPVTPGVAGSSPVRSANKSKTCGLLRVQVSQF